MRLRLLLIALVPLLTLGLASVAVAAFQTSVRGSAFAEGGDPSKSQNDAFLVEDELTHEGGSAGFFAKAAVPGQNDVLTFGELGVSARAAGGETAMSAAANAEIQDIIFGERDGIQVVGNGNVRAVFEISGQTSVGNPATDDASASYEILFGNDDGEFQTSAPGQQVDLTLSLVSNNTNLADGVLLSHRIEVAATAARESTASAFFNDTASVVSIDLLREDGTPDPTVFFRSSSGALYPNFTVPEPSALVSALVGALLLIAAWRVRRV